MACVASNPWAAGRLGMRLQSPASHATPALAALPGRIRRLVPPPPTRIMVPGMRSVAAWAVRRGVKSGSGSKKGSSCKKYRDEAELVEDDVVMPLEYQELWQERLDKVTRNDAKVLVKQLDITHPVGVRRMVKYAGDKRRTAAPCYALFVKQKMNYKDHIILIRIGSFYESVGIDAVMLVEYANLNPMAINSGVPRAGCPEMNLRMTLDRLTAAGLKVVVMEEIDQVANSSRTLLKQPKERFVAGIVTPTRSHYTYGRIEDEMADNDFSEARPIIAIAYSMSGYTVMEACLDNATSLAELPATIQEGMNEEALRARLNAGGFVPPLFLHTSSERGTSYTHNDWDKRVRKEVGLDQDTLIERFHDPDVKAGFERIVRREIGLEPDKLKIKWASPPSGQRMRAPYLSTVRLLGLGDDPHMPSLLEACVANRAHNSPLPRLPKSWLRRLLLSPPPYQVALKIRAAVKLLSELQVPLPTYYAGMPPNKITELLRSREAREGDFREMAEVIRPVLDTLQHPQLRELGLLLLPVVTSYSGQPLLVEELEEAGSAMLQEIHSVVDLEAGTMRMAHDGESQEHILDEDEEGVPAEGYGNSLGKQRGQDVADALNSFWSRYEDTFKGRVREELIAEEIREVNDAHLKVEGEANRIAEFASQDLGPAGKKWRCLHDIDNAAVWFWFLNKQSTSKEGVHALHHPYDRNLKRAETRYSTPALDDATYEYRLAVARAKDAVRRVLQDLASKLQPHVPQLVAITNLAVVAAALKTHADCAQRNAWVLPVESQRGPGERGRCVVRNFWPYWLNHDDIDNQGRMVVKNSIDLDGMILLTGPNMGGKSTVMRALGAVALLGSCGLMVPAECAELPFFDALMLRNFSGDSPLEGTSSYGMEMKEMKYICRDATHESLVLIDELGKGTEPLAGAAQAAALLERLDASQARGIFATHHHVMLVMPLRLSCTFLMQMAVEEQLDEDGKSRVVATLRLEPGFNTTTLAFDVARRMGLPQEDVDRAEELFRLIPTLAPRATAHADVQQGVQPTLPPPEAAEEPVASSLPQEPPPPPAFTLQQGSEVLCSTVAAMLREREDGNQEQSTDSTAGRSQEAPAVTTVQPGFEPPAAHNARSCVYVVRWGLHTKTGKTNLYHCGATDDIRSRFRAHQKKGKDVSMAYIVLPDHLQSNDVERRAHHALMVCGAPLDSHADANLRNMRKPRKQPPTTTTDDSDSDDDNDKPTSGVPVTRN